MEIENQAPRNSGLLTSWERFVRYQDGIPRKTIIDMHYGSGRRGESQLRRAEFPHKLSREMTPDRRDSEGTKEITLDIIMYSPPSRLKGLES